MKLYNVLIALCCCSLAVGTGCFRKDHRQITINVPQLTSQRTNCLQRIIDATKSVDGIEGVQFGEKAGTIVVSYNALKLGIRNIEFLVAGAGFDANDTKAPEQARNALPEDCRK